MSYFANNGSTTANLSLVFNNSAVGSQSNSASESDFFPWSNSLSVSATLGVSGDCGYTANGSGSGHVWHSWGSTSWGDQTTSSSNNFSQNACTQQGGSDGYEDGGDWVECTWIDYYDDEGNFVGSDDYSCQEFAE